MAYECNNSEFVFLNKNGKSVASGYTIDCKNFNDRQPLMNTNIGNDLINMGIPAGLVVNKELNTPTNYIFSKNDDLEVDDNLHSSLLKLLSKKQQMQHNIKTKRRQPSKQPKKTAKNKGNKKSKKNK